MLKNNNTYLAQEFINHLSIAFHQKQKLYKYQVIKTFISLTA